MRISDAQSDPSVGFDGTLIGDYIQVDAMAGQAWVAWVDTRTGDQNIYGVHRHRRARRRPDSRARRYAGHAARPPRPRRRHATPGPPPRPRRRQPASSPTPPLPGSGERADRPVAEGSAGAALDLGAQRLRRRQRSLPAGPGGSRLVQYFDKSRMEINNPGGDPTEPWYVTNGLLVVEMIAGRSADRRQPV